IQATDPNGDALTFSATGMPTGLTIDEASGLISGVVSSSAAASSPYSVTVTASDGTNTGSASFTWNVTNQIVTVTNPGTHSNSAGATVSVQIYASDPALHTLAFAAVGLPPGLSIGASSGLISGTL